MIIEMINLKFKVRYKNTKVARDNFESNEIKEGVDYSTESIRPYGEFPCAIPRLQLSKFPPRTCSHSNSEIW